MYGYGGLDFGTQRADFFKSRSVIPKSVHRLNGLILLKMTVSVSGIALFHMEISIKARKGIYVR